MKAIEMIRLVDANRGHQGVIAGMAITDGDETFVTYDRGDKGRDAEGEYESVSVGAVDGEIRLYANGTGRAMGRNGNALGFVETFEATDSPANHGWLMASAMREPELMAH